MTAEGDPSLEAQIPEFAEGLRELELLISLKIMEEEYLIGGE